jgi:hypothetical protein
MVEKSWRVVCKLDFNVIWFIWSDRAVLAILKKGKSTAFIYWRSFDHLEIYLT